VLTLATADRALAADWFRRSEGAGFDGLIAKRTDDRYEPGVRTWLKVKHLRTVDCVVAGLRWAKGGPGRAAGALLLGLHDGEGVLHYVGHASSFKAPERRELAKALREFITKDASEGFGDGRSPGGESRWTGARDTSWVRLLPELVCEGTFDQLDQGRFRHGSTFRRWRPDKPPEACDYDQLETAVPEELEALLCG